MPVTIEFEDGESQVGPTGPAGPTGPSGGPTGPTGPAGPMTPVGAVVLWPGAALPAGWLECDGSAVSRTTYAALFAVVGTTYGSGNGSSTFNLPNLTGRFAVGQDAGQAEFDVLGESGGSKSVTLTSAQSGLPAHGHGATGLTIGGGDHEHTQTEYTFNITSNTSVGGSAGRITGVVPNAVSTSGGGAHAHTVGGTTANNAAADAAAAHENLPPYLVLRHVIRAL